MDGQTIKPGRLRKP